jgi:methylated-DNA-[protein]-cysteine S-methyltransferase
MDPTTTDPTTPDATTMDATSLDPAMAAIEAQLRAGPEVEVADAIDRFTRRAAAEGVVDVAWAEVDTPCGEIVVAATDVGLVAVSLTDHEHALERLAAAISPRVLHAPARLDEVRRQLDEYFERRRRRFEIPLDWSLSRGFRRTVLHELVKVPYGQVVTYGELARRTANPRAVRAVGTALATNPLAIVVPCHRVLRSGGKLGNYGGGVEMKRFLLTHEGAL